MSRNTNTDTRTPFKKVNTMQLVLDLIFCFNLLTCGLQVSAYVLLSDASGPAPSGITEDPSDYMVKFVPLYHYNIEGFPSLNHV